MFCFGKKPRFLHKVKTTEVIERERNREPVRYHRSHRHGRNTFYSNGRYYSESRSRLPRAIELSRYHEDSSSFQPVRICNYREGDEHLLQQHSDNFDQYHVEEDDSREASREMVRYSANEEDERNDEVSSCRTFLFLSKEPSHPYMQTAHRQFALPPPLPHLSNNHFLFSPFHPLSLLHSTSSIHSRPLHFDSTDFTIVNPQQSILSTMMNLNPNAYPKQRHGYVYVPRANQRGYLQYAGPLNGNLGYATSAAAYGAGGYYGGGVGYPYGYPRYGAYGGYGGYGGYGYRSGYNPYYYGGVYRYANRGYQAYHQPYYSAAPAQYPYYRPATVAPVAAQHHHHYTYVTPSRTPKVLPSYYNSRDYDSRRYAADRGAYSARRIKPADALPDDPFWCRERDGQWHLRTFYSIERECYPGRWQMDAEKGFLVYHRE